MEQPAAPNAIPQTPRNKSNPTNNNNKKKLPTPQDLISHYESQGLDTQQASLKVIDDLQHVLFRMVSSSSAKTKIDKFMAETSRKIDAANSRLAILDLKLDSKPGYAETFAIGVASGAALRGIGSVMPHVVGALGQIWSSVRSAAKPSPPS